MGRHSKPKASDLWKGQQWKKLRQNLFRLQRRLYKAVRDGNLRKARSLQKLIMKSRSAQLLAIRQVTQLNKGKKTPGIDGKSSLTCQQRLNVLELLNQHASDWKHAGLREIPIAKKNGKTRLLKIPTIADRAWQCLVKYALEPAHEATFHACSYGFRTGRSAHDAQKHVFDHLKSKSNGITKRVIELDIKKCFDRINHSTITDNLIAPKSIKQGIFRCLKAGVNPEFPEQGTPQGGVVSPLLANVALNGIEEIHPSIRYADDMVIFLKPKDNAEKVLQGIKRFLNERGMEISEEKTKITHSIDGFDFLGWNFRVQKNGKFRSIPSAENLRTIKKKIKAVVNNSNYGAKIKAQKLAPIVRGWRNYHRNCKMDGSRNSLWFTNERTRQRFIKEKKIDKHEAARLVKKAFPAVKYKENKHIKVKGTKSPYDGDLVYWSQRNSGLYDNATSKALKKQNHCCGYCGHKLLGEESVHLHHIDGNHDNWKPKNLLAVHRSCHQYIHSSQKDT
ncbi:reverse transcriptase domain-containing protein [Moorena producens JHB]|uniref:Reverse transcriptase domain-containing protein n=1 Tax=Moorena producens (strain JHB) TaxID=1454205 RepID=A0A1D9G2R6_MOOP1|nr:reverse transcriptase domain-containing protein [Moorena producens]AOY81917.1 reverse transcriptase domain-containing protein [Moorena producens JHB]